MKKILISVLIIILALGVTGCGGESPEQAVKNTLDAIKAGDVEKASKYVDYDKLQITDKSALNAEDKEKSEEMAKMIFKNIKYKVLESSEDGNTATVKAEITNLDMGNVMTDFVSQLLPLAFSGLSKEQMNEKSEEVFVSLISKESKTVTKTVELNLSKKDDNWKIESSDEFSDAVLGGLITYSNNMKDSFGGGNSAKKLNEINNWLIGDIWNKGFVDISAYIANGTSSTGSSLDVEFTVEQLKNAIDKKAAYNDYINELKGEEYSQIKLIWNKLSPEIDTLYNQIKETPPVAKDTKNSLDTGKFVQYQEAFTDAVHNLDK